MWQAIIWTNADPAVHWRIYAALGGDELIYHSQDTTGRSTTGKFSESKICYVKWKCVERWTEGVDECIYQFR